MKLQFIVATTLLGLATMTTTVAQADEDQRYEHFKGQPAKTLDQALFNLASFNEKMTELMADGELTAEDMATVHQLSYTLENALQKLDEEVDTLQEVLEEVHIASETMDYDTVKKQGKIYLETSAKIVKK
ncbi:DUF6746 family protein [Pseudidiomarina sp. E22-M8]|uniref:DUF6746 family protein n=1 Tax=Pseudidiomarina sp. E22-M8 TaxID=3424768 RepID=UPI00403C613C